MGVACHASWVIGAKRTCFHGAVLRAIFFTLHYTITSIANSFSFMFVEVIPRAVDASNGEQH